MGEREAAAGPRSEGVRGCAQPGRLVRAVVVGAAGLSCVGLGLPTPSLGSWLWGLVAATINMFVQGEPGGSGACGAGEEGALVPGTVLDCFRSRKHCPVAGRSDAPRPKEAPGPGAVLAPSWTLESTAPRPPQGWRPQTRARGGRPGDRTRGHG